MIGAIYIEDAVADHQRAIEICRRLPKAAVIPCARYGEVFNPRHQEEFAYKVGHLLRLTERSFAMDSGASTGRLGVAVGRCKEVFREGASR